MDHARGSDVLYQGSLKSNRLIPKVPTMPEARHRRRQRDPEKRRLDRRGRTLDHDHARRADARLGGAEHGLRAIAEGTDSRRLPPPPPETRNMMSSGTGVRSSDA